MFSSVKWDGSYVHPMWLAKGLDSECEKCRGQCLIHKPWDSLFYYYHCQFGAYLIIFSPSEA